MNFPPVHAESPILSNEEIEIQTSNCSRVKIHTEWKMWVFDKWRNISSFWEKPSSTIYHYVLLFRENDVAYANVATSEIKRFKGWNVPSFVSSMTISFVSLHSFMVLLTIIYFVNTALFFWWYRFISLLILIERLYNCSILISGNFAPIFELRRVRKERNRALCTCCRNWSKFWPKRQHSPFSFSNHILLQIFIY